MLVRSMRATQRVSGPEDERLDARRLENPSFGTACVGSHDGRNAHFAQCRASRSRQIGAGVAVHGEQVPLDLDPNLQALAAVAPCKRLRVADEGLACTACHDPHEPLFMDRDLRTARLHPLIQRCRDCHAGRADETLPRPDHHPAIFECRYCHAPVVADYETRPHKVVRCTTCHIFFRASAFAGRILRDADPRFCLLCHGEAEFRSNTSAPGISWPDGHLDDVADDEADRTKRCIDCHRDRIHLLSHELVRPPAAPPNGGEEGADDEE